MKKVINTLLSGLLLLGMTGCEKELQPFDTEDCWIHFYFKDIEDNYIFDENTPKTAYSFVYKPEAVTDTLWYEVETMGLVADRPRTFELMQVHTGENDAVAGEHYVAFDDPGLRAWYTMPAHVARCSVPIVVKRVPSLDEKDVLLQVTFKENSEFRVGYAKYATRYITISNDVAELNAWDNTMTFYFGTYGKEKHKFLIANDPNHGKWDDEYVAELSGGDPGYLSYLQGLMRRKLTEENARRAAEGLGVLAEEDGTPVRF